MSSSDSSCPSDAYFGNPVNAFVGNWSFQKFASVVSGACTAVSVLLCFTACIRHLFTYRDRHEQRQIARILLTPAIIAISVFLGVVAYPASGFLRPVGEYYDAIALVGLYLLLITYATPAQRRGSPRDLYGSIPQLYARHANEQVRGNELSQYYRSWFLVFQTVPVRLITMIALMATDGTICDQLKSNHRAATIVSAVNTASTIICFLSVIRMIRFIKPSLVGQRPFMKTIALKGLVGFSVLFSLVYPILGTTGVVGDATSTMNKKDWKIGLPGMIVCCASVIFSVLIVIPYGTVPYSRTARPDVEKLSVFRAIFDLVNITDVIIVGVACMPSAWSNWRAKPEQDMMLTYHKHEEDGRANPLRQPPLSHPHPQRV